MRSAPAARSLNVLDGAPGALDVLSFGRLLVETGDLDPLYVALVGAGLTGPEMRRFCLAYWLFYNAGVAARCAESEGPRFWAEVAQAEAITNTRGSERRHWRGAASKDCLSVMRARYPRPESAFDSLLDALPPPIPYALFSARIRRWPAFGPWIAFKAADMVDRVLGIPIDWSGTEPPKEPLAACALVDPIAPWHLTVVRLIEGLRDLPAPPRGDRACGFAEAETVLCKYKSHVNGRYPVGKDSRELLHALAGRGSLASRLLEAAPDPDRAARA